MSEPKVFLSYSHDSEGHKTWVLKLATDLRINGVDASLDIWDLSPGQDTVTFMANGLAGRELTAASPRRVIVPAKTKEDASEAQIVDVVGQLRPRLVDHVIRITEPLFMLFDFKRFNQKVYRELVEDFAEGKIT